MTDTDRTFTRAEVRQIMAAYRMAVIEGDDAENPDLALEVTSHWFARWMRLNYPSSDVAAEHSGDCNGRRWGCGRCEADKEFRRVDAALEAWGE